MPLMDLTTCSGYSITIYNTRTEYQFSIDFMVSVGLYLTRLSDVAGGKTISLGEGEQPKRVMLVFIPAWRPRVIFPK